MKVQVLQTMRLESGFQIAPNWSEIGKMTMTLQFADMTSSSNFFDVVLFLFSSYPIMEDCQAQQYPHSEVSLIIGNVAFVQIASQKLPWEHFVGNKSKGC